MVPDQLTQEGPLSIRWEFPIIGKEHICPTRKPIHYRGDKTYKDLQSMIKYGTTFLPPVRHADTEGTH